MLKSKLRKKVFKIRELKNSKNTKLSFKNIFNLLKRKNIKTKSIGGYFPVNFEIDDLDILKKFEKNKYEISLPVIKKNFSMDFYKWNSNDPLIINKYGIPEPSLECIRYPDIILVPLLAFDERLYRLGYGGGYYDRYIEKVSKKKPFIKVGLALSVQKINNIPTTKYDKKLDYIVTEKYIL